MFMVAEVVESEAAACVEGREVLRGSGMMRVGMIAVLCSCHSKRKEERFE